MTANVIRPVRRAASGDEPEWAVWLLVAAMLAIGLLARTVITTRTERIDEASVGLRYPAGWTQQPAGGPFEIAAVGESLETSLFPSSVRVYQMPVTEISESAQSLGDLALKWTNQQSESQLAYRVFEIEPTTVAGKEAVRIDYAYVADAALGGPAVPPIVVRGEDTLIRSGETITVVSFVANDDVYASQGSIRERILASFEVK